MPQYKFTVLLFFSKVLVSYIQDVPKVFYKQEKKKTDIPGPVNLDVKHYPLPLT